jgi:hypothetical protein
LATGTPRPAGRESGKFRLVGAEGVLALRSLPRGVVLDLDFEDLLEALFADLDTTDFDDVLDVAVLDADGLDFDFDDV